MNLNVSISRRERSSHVADLETRTGFFVLEPGRSVTSGQPRVQASVTRWVTAAGWGLGPWRSRTRDVTGALILPDTSGGTSLIAVKLERQPKSGGRKDSWVSWQGRAPAAYLPLISDFFRVAFISKHPSVQTQTLAENTLVFPAAFFSHFLRNWWY